MISRVKSRKQRVELYLPILYNPDSRGRRKPIPAELLRITKDELTQYFAQQGLSFEFVTRTRIYGEWKGIEDEILLIKIDVRMKVSGPGWLKQYKEVLKKRFEQEEIYIVYYDIIVV
jgi:hypothetical protein